MHDYVRGAFEALSWVKYILSDLEKDPEGIAKALREVKATIEDINRGVAVDFRERLRTF